MTLALQIPPTPQEQCLDFRLAYEIAQTVCKSIGFNFDQARLSNIAIIFDALVCEGESPTKSLTTAIDIEIALRGNPQQPRRVEQKQSQGMGLQRMAHDEEQAVLALMMIHNIPASSLTCKFSRQKGKGKFKASREFKYLPQNWNISYDLILCEYCGNFEGMKANTPYCPAKLRLLRDRLLGDDSPTSSDNLLTEGD